MNRPLKVLFLTQTFPRFADDTAGPFIRELARGLVAGGDEVTVLTPHAAGVEATWEVDGVRVESFRYAPQVLELIGYSRSLDRDEAIRLGAKLATPLYVLGARRKIRQVLRRARFDLLHAHWVVPNALVAAPFAGDLPIGPGLHGSDVFLAERAGVRKLVSHALARSSFLTGCSPELVDRVAALGFPREDAAVIPYGVDVDTFSPDRDRGWTWRQELGIPEGAPLILGVGRMVTKKGFHVLLEVLPSLLEEFSSSHFCLAGAGDLLEGFRERTFSWSDRVHLPGIVLRDTLPDLYRGSDIFVLPAVHDAKGNVDGLPNVILEAMASGLPVVASGISGIPQVVESGDNGLLVEERKPDQLRAALAELLSAPDRAREMGERSRARAEAELTWTAIAGRYRESYVDGLNRALETRS
ncbi:MAG: glycosyltransferase [Thermoanaerobaculia bacterium]